VENLASGRTIEERNWGSGSVGSTLGAEGVESSSRQRSLFAIGLGVAEKKKGRSWDDRQGRKEASPGEAFLFGGRVEVQSNIPFDR